MPTEFTFPRNDDYRPVQDASKTYKPLLKWLEILNENWDALDECVYVWMRLASPAALNATVDGVIGYRPIRNLESLPSLTPGVTADTPRMCIRLTNLAIQQLERFRSLTRLLVTWCDTQQTTTLDPSPLDVSLRYIEGTDERCEVIGEFDLRQPLNESFRRACEVLNRALVLAAIRAGRKPPETPRASFPNDARDEWLYAQCCKGTKYILIKSRLAKRKNWEQLGTINGIKCAAKRYAERNRLPPIPTRQHGRRAR